MGELYRDAWNINKKQVQNHYGTIPSIYVHLYCSLCHHFFNSAYNQSHLIFLVTPLLLYHGQDLQGPVEPPVYCFFAHQIWLPGFLRRHGMVFDVGKSYPAIAAKTHSTGSRHLCNAIRRENTGPQVVWPGAQCISHSNDLACGTPVATLEPYAMRTCGRKKKHECHFHMGMLNDKPYLCLRYGKPASAKVEGKAAIVHVLWQNHPPDHVDQHVVWTGDPIVYCLGLGQ